MISEADTMIDPLTAAKNPKTHSETLDKLADNPYPDVLRAVATNTNASLKTLAKLFVKYSDLVSSNPAFVLHAYEYPALNQFVQIVSEVSNYDFMQQVMEGGVSVSGQFADTFFVALANFKPSINVYYLVKNTRLSDETLTKIFSNVASQKEGISDSSRVAILKNYVAAGFPERRSEEANEAAADVANSIKDDHAYVQYFTSTNFRTLGKKFAKKIYDEVERRKVFGHELYLRKIAKYL